MSNRSSAAGLAVVLGLVFTACSADPVNTSSTDAGARAPRESSATGAASAPKDTGGTMTGAGGSVGGSAGPTGEKENQRGNTPPGTSRDGQGPAAGAIVDPTGAATGKR
jgi:hypothetical protein